jgi:hypothetical protein
MRFNLSTVFVVAATILSFVFPVHADIPLIQQIYENGELENYCTDMLGQQVQNRVDSNNQNNVRSQRDFNSRHRSGQAEIDVLRIVRLGGGGSNATVSDTSSFFDRSHQSYSDHSSIRTEAVGRNCTDVIHNVGIVDATRINADAQQRMFLFDSLLGW